MTISRPWRACGAILAPALALTFATPGVAAPYSDYAPVAPGLARASAAATRADRSLVFDAKAFRSCLSSHAARPAHCSPARRAVQRAGSNLAGAERRLARIARATGRVANAGAHSAYTRNPRLAPRLAAIGKSLRWSRVANLGVYVVMREVPAQGEQFELVRTQWFTPPPVPGVTVRYRVRTAVRGSTWSLAQTIAYPPSGGPTTSDAQAAPAVAVSGPTLTWSEVAGVTTYVLSTKVPGQPDRYAEVSGSSVTPPAVPGDSVHYSVRTAVEGSAWAPEVAVHYPSASAPAPSPAPQPERQPSPSPAPSGPFEVGLNAGTSTYELPFIQTIGAHTVRMDVGIESPVSELTPLVEAYARAGVRLLLIAGFQGRVPSPSEALNVASWAAAFGPGGSLWRGRTFPAGTAMTDIEFGNETSYTYQFSDNSPAAYAGRAQAYALRFKEAQIAIQAANPQVGLLAQADSGGNGSAWVDNMFAAVPDLAARVAGWTVHPYGSSWQQRMDELVASTAAHGAPSTIPIYITEWGLATDNGRCLSDNYGWNRCMSYAEAAGTLTSTLGAMRARYGGRLAAFYLYHVRDQQPSGASSEREAYFGALQSNDGSKGQYTAAVQSLVTANP